MKRWILTLMIALFALPAAAQEDALPAGVKALCDKAYPAYILAAHDGWGDETQGQYALVLTDGEDNILCIAEKAAGDAAYAFTVENTNAVREGAEIPSLLIDTGGDSLFYSYWDYDMYKYSYHCEKRNGEWGKVSLEYLDTGYVNYDMNIWVGASGDVLAYDVNHFDKRENPVAFDKPVYMDIPISDAFASQLQLEWFDIAMLSPEPGLISPYPGLCGPLLEEGDELHELNVQEDTLIMLVKKADGTKRLRITDGWDDYKNDYAVVETGPLPGEAGMDTWHGSAGRRFIWSQTAATSLTLARRAMANGTCPACRRRKASASITTPCAAGRTAAYTATTARSTARPRGARTSQSST